ncbi:MAG: serine/threonine protein kinase [Desulfobulbaceae bacterium]|nr:serine/threonine protein kinase [Desulfobulbaceae bacterium]
MSENAFSENSIRDRIGSRFGSERIPKKFQIIRDTSDFFRVEYNDVIILGEKPFWVKRYEKEGRFGLDDEPKYWVRRAVDIEDGSTKILKLVFHERFDTKIGNITIECYRSPKKEARILDLVAGHENFMHGHWVLDSAGNIIRILDFIPGRQIDKIIVEYGNDHEDYFYNYFPSVLDTYIEMVLAIKFLHDNEEKHGDIRRDHILWDRERKIYRWIDFDYNYRHGESMFSFDIQGLGNILIFLVGRGDVLVPELYAKQRDLFDSLWGEDLNISYKNRVANLKKIFPYIPDSLNRVLQHFSWGAQIFYENTEQMLDDLYKAKTDVIALSGS